MSRPPASWQLALGLAVVRIAAGATLLLAHGLPKLAKWGQLRGSFPDPLGIGSEPSLALTLFAEVLCAGLVAIGLFARIASLPVIVTMLVAFFVVHGGDPFAQKELALMYLVPFVAVSLAGPGSFAVDGFRQ